MIYKMEIIEVNLVNKKIIEPLIMYTDPTEYEFYELLKPMIEFIDNKKVQSDIIRGCITRDGIIYIWNPEILHDYLKTLKEFKDIYDEDKFRCIVIDSIQGYERLIEIKDKLIKDNWIIN